MDKPWFTVTTTTPHSPPAAFAILTDFTKHSAPGTTVYYTTSQTTGAGATFNARTKLGPLAFDDNMTITDWEPPTGSVSGHCYIDKIGPHLRGQAQIIVTPHADGSLVEWREWITLGTQPLTWISGKIALLAGPFVFGAVVKKLLAQSAATDDEA